jgi:regulator of cell morphogenesis and NO signaling
MYQKENLYLSVDTKISDIILNNPYLMLMLEHFGIQLPLQDKSLTDVCIENRINTELFIIFANLYNGVQSSFTNQFTYREILTIVTYLKNSHSYYSQEIYPNILTIIRQMNKANDLKEMALVEKFFDNYFAEVNEHLNYENEIVFPYIIGLYEELVLKKRPADKEKYAVSDYQEHHNDIEEKLTDLNNLLVKYLPQKNDQPIRRKLLQSLFELEYDLNIHSQIENLILIPLVAEMEQQKLKTV